MPVRIYDIAKKFGIESKAVLAKARELGIAAMVPSSSLDKLTAEFLESHFRPPESNLPNLQVLPPPDVAIEADSLPPVVALSPELAPSYRDDSYGIRLVRDSEVEMHTFADDGFRRVGRFAFIVSPENVGASGSNSASDPDKVVLLTNSESGSLEFKPAARWDCYQSRHNPELQKAIVKTVAAFLNTDGGTLLIGVADNGRVLGLKEDFATLQKPKEDDYLLFLNNLLCTCFSSPLRETLNKAWISNGRWRWRKKRSAHSGCSPRSARVGPHWGSQTGG